MAIVESCDQTNASVRSKETKSGRARSVALPSLVVEKLCRHRLRAAEEMFRPGARVDPDVPVVAKDDETPLQPNGLTHEFVRILARAKALPKVRSHDLRHRHATHLPANRVRAKIAQERLGHCTIGITLDLYRHMMPAMQENAAAKVDAAIRAAQNSVSEAIG